MILILTGSLDPHADLVEQKLRERGVDFVRFNPGQFPSRAEVSLSYSSKGQPQYTLRAGEVSLDLSRLKSIWYRHPEPPAPHEEVKDEITRDYVEKECKDFIFQVWELPDCLWFPAPPSVIQRAQHKALQLQLARALGFELPPTLITNSPKDFLEFYRQHNGNIVSKIAGPTFWHQHAGKTFCRYTEVVSKRDLGYAQSIRYCPVIFQGYVPKRVELRITIVGQRVFAAEIHSQQSNHTRHDWRRYDKFRTPYFPHELPRDVRQLCVKFVKQLGLCYGAIDMVLTPEGHYVFLEINPLGQSLWIEQETGLPISDAICDLLMSESPRTKPAEHLFECNEGSLR
jgi:hypothetical protein